MKPKDPSVERHRRLVGRNIRKIRKARGITQRELGNALGVSNQQVSRIESGQRNISVDALFVISRCLGCETAEFLEADDVPSLDAVLGAVEAHWEHGDRTSLVTDLRKHISI